MATPAVAPPRFMRRAKVVLLRLAKGALLLRARVVRFRTRLRRSLVPASMLFSLPSLQPPSHPSLLR